MAIAWRPSRTLALLVVLMLLWAPLMPAIDTDPPEQDADDTRSGPPSDVGKFLSDDGDEVIPIYTIFQGPQEVSQFGSSVTNLGDVDGDGLDDMVIGSGYGVLEKLDPDEIWPFWMTMFLLPGDENRSYDKTDLEAIGNATSSWYYHAQRWIGDVNGDGHADLVNMLEYGIRTQEPYPIPNLTGPYLMVHYGTDDGIPESPDLFIDLKPEGVPEYQWISIQFGGVGDVNGDGYDDLFVYRNPFEVWDWEEEERPPPPPGDTGRDDDDPTDPDEPPRPEPEVTYYPGDFQLFYGSADGLPSEPSWNATPEMETEYWYLQGVHHADLNGDGYSDIILASTSAPHIRVYHGSADGISIAPDLTISFSTEFTYGWRLQGPVDFDGDEYDDIVVDYGQPQGLFDYVQYIYVFQGSEEGISSNPSYDTKLDSFETAKVVMVDVNGDGLDDAFLHGVEPASTSENFLNVKLNLHFNSGGELPEDPSWQHIIKEVEGNEVGQLTDGGDFDGDGYGDLVMGVPHYPYWDGRQPQSRPGHVVIVHGGGIMDRMRPLTLRDGPELYAGYKDYDFRVNANPTGVTILPNIIRLVLDLNGANVVLEAGLPLGGSYIMEKTDPDDLVDLKSTLMDIDRDTENNTVWIHFRVLFNWTWPHEEPCDVKVESVFETATTPWTAKDLFFVENDLDFFGDLEAIGAVQGELEENGWVKAGELVNVSGPKVVYEGTEEVFPPDGVCTVVLEDNDGTFSSASHVAGEPVHLALAMDASTDLDENLTLTLRDLPGLATVVSEPVFKVRVDGDLPSFTNVVPDPDDWHSSSQVIVAITADDGVTSGVRAASLEYAYSTDGGGTWSVWTTVGLTTTHDGPTVDGMVELDLPDGADNFVRWRVRDLVGNGPAVSTDLRVRVDTINVTYTNAFPDPGTWLTNDAVECGVTIRDEDGAGIEVVSIQYRISHHNLSGYGEWTDWDEGSLTDAQAISVSQVMEMGEGPYNYVQWRAKDIAGNGYTTSPHFRVRVDTTPVSFYALEPVDGVFDVAEVTCWANATDGALGSGVDLASIEYRVQSAGEWRDWASVGMNPTDPEVHERFSVVVRQLLDGTNRVMFRGSDLAGNGPTESPEIVMTVDTTGPAFGEVSPAADEKQPYCAVQVTVTVSDAVTGVASETLMYQYSTEGEAGLVGEWTEVTGNPTEDGSYLIELGLDLAPGVDNVVQFRAIDMLGNKAESEVSTIWVNRAPTASIRSPKSDQLYSEAEPVELNASGSSDPDEGDVLYYTWYIEGSATPLGTGRVLRADLPAGTYNVTLVVADDVGAEHSASVRVTVEQYVPPENITSSGIWWILLALVIIVGVLVAVYMMRRRAQDEWEEIPA